MTKLKVSTTDPDIGFINPGDGLEFDMVGNVGIGQPWSEVRMHVHSGDKSRLFITPEFMMEFPHKIPNWWHRFWCRAFFGFRWESIG